jgi:hypothetical protein
MMVGHGIAAEALPDETISARILVIKVIRAFFDCVLLLRAPVNAEILVAVAEIVTGVHFDTSNQQI